MKRRYEMTGRPIGTQFAVLTDHAVGDVFTASLDAETEEHLIGSGALRIVESKKASDGKGK